VAGCGSVGLWVCGSVGVCPSPNRSVFRDRQRHSLSYSRLSPPAGASGLFATGFHGLAPVARRISPPAVASIGIVVLVSETGNVTRCRIPVFRPLRGLWGYLLSVSTGLRPWLGVYRPLRGLALESSLYWLPESSTGGGRALPYSSRRRRMWITRLRKNCCLTHSSVYAKRAAAIGISSSRPSRTPTRRNHRRRPQQQSRH
jgi:hypothetical protein